MSRIYAAYVIVNLLLFTIRMSDEALGAADLRPRLHAIAVGVSSGCAFSWRAIAPLLS